MTITPVGIGSTANDGTGDPLRTAFGKLNANDTELRGGSGFAVPAGRSWCPFFTGFQQSGGASAGLLRFVPFRFPQTVTVDQIGVLFHANNAAVNFKCGIWANGIDGVTGDAVPLGAPLAVIPSTAAASQNTKASITGGAVTFAAGIYWFGEVHDATIDVVTNIANSAHLVGTSSDISITNGAFGGGGFHRTASHTYANALPTLGSNATAEVNYIGAATPYFRISNPNP